MALGDEQDATPPPKQEYNLSKERLKQCKAMIRTCTNGDFQISQEIFDEYNAQIKGK